MARWTAKSIGYLANQLSHARSSVDAGTAVPFSCDKLSVDAPKLDKAGRDALRRSLPPPKRQGKAVFLLGAGCSRSAGIPVAADVARYAAIYLQEVYSHDPGDTLPLVALADHVGCLEEFQKKATAALHWLDDKGKLLDFEIGRGNPDWGRLYVYFLENDLASPNRQREFLSELISRAGGKLNWAHACLGELVHQGYVGTVMTTNFDQLAFQAVARAGTLPVIADGLEALTRVVAEPTEPQIIYLHGSMHTYSPRNSRMSVRQTDEHEVLPAVLYTLLHRSDLLIVVGYAGGEEGIMQLLKRIARQLPSLMIFWVLYESDEGALSPGAVSLLSIGENKFLISDTGADEFFRDLMNELGLGVPGWIEDPFARLARDAAQIKGMDDKDVKSSILRMQKLVQVASDKAEKPTPAEAASLARLKANYEGALEALAGAGDGVDATLDRATTRYKLAQDTKKDEATAALTQIIAELDGASATDLSDEQRAQELKLRVQALRMLRDFNNSPELNDKIVEAADSALSIYSIYKDRQRWVEIQISLAQALIEICERDEGDCSDKLDKARQAFTAALTVLEDSSSAQLAEVKEGLASILERQADAQEGEKRRELLKQAVAERLELTQVGEAHSKPKNQASRYENAASAMKELAKTFEGGRHFSLMRQADDLIARAEAIYHREGAHAAEDLARVQGARHRADQ